jgi:type VI secretion system protein ImpF
VSRKPRGSGQASTAPRRASAHLLPTLIDRLRDDAPHRQVETAHEYAVTPTRMRDIIQRDLTFLLNATSIEDLIDRKRYPHAAASTVNFGVRPLAGAFTASRRWTEIEKSILHAIGDFEPRLVPGSVRIVPLTEADGNAHYNELAFEIRGTIRMDPYPLEFLVQSSLDLESSRLYTNAR